MSWGGAYREESPVCHRKEARRPRSTHTLRAKHQGYRDGKVMDPLGARISDQEQSYTQGDNYKQCDEGNDRDPKNYKRVSGREVRGSSIEEVMPKPFITNEKR